MSDKVFPTENSEEFCDFHGEGRPCLTLPEGHVPSSLNQMLLYRKEPVQGCCATQLPIAVTRSLQARPGRKKAWFWFRVEPPLAPGQKHHSTEGGVQDAESGRRARKGVRDQIPHSRLPMSHPDTPGVSFTYGVPPRQSGC